MACACKVNQNLQYLNKKYGNKSQKTDLNIGFKVFVIAMNLLGIFIAILLIPIMICHLIYKDIKKEPVSIKKLISLGKNVRHK